MKLLVSRRAWQEWIHSVFGARFEASFDAPRAYPCYAYAVVDSLRDMSQIPLYLYRSDIEAMGIELVASELTR